MLARGLLEYEFNVLAINSTTNLGIDSTLDSPIDLTTYFNNCLAINLK